MMRSVRRFFGNSRRALIVAAVPIMATGALFAASATAQASAAPKAAQSSVAPQPAQAAAAVKPCNFSSYLCFWVDTGYTGNMGKLAGSNGNWAIFPQAQCAGGTWNDCASSAYNDGEFDAVRLRQDINGGGGFFCIPLGVGYSNFTILRFSNGANLNDAVSSNYWQSTATCS